jgi:hypothetical protein
MIDPIAKSDIETKASFHSSAKSRAYGLVVAQSFSSKLASHFTINAKVFIRRLKTDREKKTGCSTVHTREIRHLDLGADGFVKGYVGKGSTFQCALNNFLRTNHP